MSKRELAIALLIFMGLLVPLIPFSECALIPQDQTINIVDTHDDKYVTELGVGIDSYLVHVLDPTYDLRAFTIFRNVSINFWEPLHNATLRLYTGNTLDFDKDSTITIYGMKIDELQNILPIGPSDILSMPLTDHYVNFNTSQFYGVQWHEIDVTTLVEELIRAHNWDGDGITGGEIGDTIGFIMLGAKGHDVRYFVDYRNDPALSAKLRIRWNHQPPLNDPPDDYDFVEQYKNHSIWRDIPLEGPINYVFIKTPSEYDIYYDSVHPIPGSKKTVTTTTLANALQYGSRRHLTRDRNGTLHVVYPRVYDWERTGILTKRSHDDGATWINETYLSGNAGRKNYNQVMPSIAVDSQDNLHVVWSGKATAYPDYDQVWYTKYSINIQSWSTPLRISTYSGMESGPQSHSSIAVDSNNLIYVAWDGTATGFPTESQTWIKNYTDSWSNPLRISTASGMATKTTGTPGIAVDSNNSIHISFTGLSGDYPVSDQIWYVNYTTATSWGTPIRISTYAGMDTETQGENTIALDTNNTIYVSWQGEATGYPDFSQIWIVNKTTSWGDIRRISTYDGMQSYHQANPTITLSYNDTIYVIWYGMATGHTNNTKIWLGKYNTSWCAELLQEVGYARYPNARWSRWPGPENDTFFNTDLNGTFVQGPFDTLEEAKACLDAKQPIDPMDPEPPGWEDTPVAFSRFRLRLYLLIVGYGCIWGPIWFFCWRRPSGYYICGGALVMLMGLGLLIQIIYV